MLRTTNHNEPYILDLNKMNNMMKMNRLNTQAMTKREKAPEVLMTKPEISKSIDIAVDRPDIIGDKYRKTAALQIQLNLLAKNAIVDELDFKPKVIKSDVTQKMIDEYRAEQQKPVMIEGKYFKYHPSTVDTNLEQPVFNAELTPAEIQQAKTEKARLVKDLGKINFNLTKKIPFEEQQAVDAYNKAKAVEKKGAPPMLTPEKYAALKRAADLAINITQQRPIAKELNFSPQLELIKNKTVPERRTALIAEIDRQLLIAPAVSRADADFEASKNKIAAETAIERQALLDTQGLIDDIDLIFAGNATVKSDNRIEQARVEKINRSKLDAAYSDLKTLNTGLMTPDQQPGETDDDFRQRLISVGIEEQDDATVESNANLVNVVRAKGNLKDILLDEGTILTVIKKLDKDEVFTMNKKWEAIKKKFLETYGFNNKQINDQDIVDFVRQMLNYMGGELAVNPVKVEAKPAPPTTVPTGITLDQSRFVALSNKISLPIYNLALDYLGIPRQGTRASSLSKLLEQGYDNKVKIEELAHRQDDKLRAEAGGAGGAEAGATEIAPVVGAGIHLPEYPRYIKLGSIYMEPAPLFYHNILKIRGNKGKNGEHYRFVGINDVKVSDVLRSIIIKLTNGETITKYDTNMLNSHDKVIYDNLMIVSNLHKSHESSVDETARNLKTRFEIIEGEIEAGNNNPKLLKELYDVLHQMAHHHIISKSEARRWWADFNQTN